MSDDASNVPALDFGSEIRLTRRAASTSDAIDMIAKRMRHALGEHETPCDFCEELIVRAWLNDLTDIGDEIVFATSMATACYFFAATRAYRQHWMDRAVCAAFLMKKLLDKTPLSLR